MIQICIKTLTEMPMSVHFTQHMENNVSIRCYLLADIRGLKSQSWLAQRLGVSRTQVHRWENGSNSIKWESFKQICMKRRSLSAAIENVISETPTPNYSAASLVRFLIPRTMRISEVADKLGCSRYTVSRWFNNKIEPDLDDVLQAFFVFKPMLLRNFLTPLVSQDFFEAHKELFQSAKIETDLTYEYPLIAFIPRCLELKEYVAADKHLNGFISRKAGISIEEEKKLLGLMEQAGLLSFEGGKYRGLNPQVDTRGNFKGGVRIRRYWIERAMAVLDQQKAPSKNATFGTNAFSVSQESYDKIRQLYLTFFEDMRNIISSDKKVPELAAVISIQIFDPSEG